MDLLRTNLRRLNWSAFWISARIRSTEAPLPLLGDEPKQKAFAKRPSIWNPFRGLETEADAREAAKVGAAAAGIIVIEHVVFALIAGTRWATVGNFIAIALMGLLAWS